MDKTKCATFDPGAQDAFPDHIKVKMAADRAVARSDDDDQSYLRRIIRSGDKTYFVKFYDNDKKLLVHADSFTKAGILAMAYSILKDGTELSIEYVEDLSGTKVPVDIKD